MHIHSNGICSSLPLEMPTENEFPEAAASQAEIKLEKYYLFFMT